MRRLSRTTLAELRAEPARADLALPAYDPAELASGIAHIGVGSFHRSHQAAYVDRLVGRGQARDRGIVGLGLMPGDRAVRDALRAQDHLYTVVAKHADGSLAAQVVGSVVEVLCCPPAPEPGSDSPEDVLVVLTDPRIRLVTLTVTEGGYHADDTTGELVVDAALEADLDTGRPPTTAFGFLVEALARRRAAGTAPFTVLSCDNLPGNGELCRRVLVAFARLRDPGTAAWIEEHVRFPSSMVDRITPATQDADRRAVADTWGFEDAWPVVCEPFTQWVVEDDLGPERPPLEDVGVQLVPDVRPFELAKLRMLNAGHQLLGHVGLLLGLTHVHDAVADPDLRGLLRDYLLLDAAPMLERVPGLDPEEYAASLLDRFANPHVADPLERLVAHAEDRVPAFLLPVVRDLLARGADVRRPALVVAAWLQRAGDSPVPAPVLEPGLARAVAAARTTLDHDGPRAAIAAARARPEQTTQEDA